MLFFCVKMSFVNVMCIILWFNFFSGLKIIEARLIKGWKNVFFTFQCFQRFQCVQCVHIWRFVNVLLVTLFAQGFIISKLITTLGFTVHLAAGSWISVCWSIAFHPWLLFSECYIFAFCVDYSCSNGYNYVPAVDSVGCLLLCALGTYDSHDTLPVTTWESFCYAKVRPTGLCVYH